MLDTSNWCEENQKKYKRAVKAFKHLKLDEVDLSSIKAGCLKHNQKIFSNFNQKYPDIISSTCELIYFAKHKDEVYLFDKLFCPICGNRTNLRDHNYGFTRFCGKTCANKSEQSKENHRKMSLSRHGVDSPNKLEWKKEKIRQTCLEKYNCENVFQIEEIKEQIRKTNLEKYGDEVSLRNDEIKNKIKNTCLKRYGYENPTQSPEVKLRTLENNIKKYGVPYPNMLEEVKEKARQTNIKNWGVPYVSHLDWKKEKNKITSLKNWGTEFPCQNEEIKQRIKNTCLEKYGYENPAQSPEIRAILRENSPIRLAKAYITKKKNNSFNTSKDEDDILVILKKYFPRVIRQYKSDEYPFACDFYIPINDLYIEYQGTWTHGDEPFDKNNKGHRKIIKEWKKKAKNSKYYQIAIKVRTVTDVKKRELANENGLNYLEFFNMKEFEEWVESLKPKRYYHNMKFKSSKLKNLWSKNKIRYEVVSYCRKEFGLGLGEINKKHIVKAMRELY